MWLTCSTFLLPLCFNAEAEQDDNCVMNVSGAFVYVNTSDVEQSQAKQVENHICGFSVADTVKYAVASDAAYKKKKQQTITHQLNDFEDTIPFSSQNTNLLSGDNYGYVGIQKDGKYALVFAGTTGDQNIATDIKFLLKEESGVKYHAGILDAYKDVEQQVLEIFSKIAEKQNVSVQSVFQKTVVTGHSLGGGMALIAADILLRKGYEVDKVITYAAPGVLHCDTAKELEEKMKDRILIVEQFSDPVPIMNPLSLFNVSSVGRTLNIPYSKADRRHGMAGYIFALETLSMFGAIETSSLLFSKKWTFSEDSCKNTIFDRGFFGFSALTYTFIKNSAFEDYKRIDEKTLIPEEKKQIKEPALKKTSILTTITSSIRSIWSRSKN